MAAATPRRAPLELVAEPDSGANAGHTDWLASNPTTNDAQWRTRAVIDQWQPEHQLIGALMWLTASQARPIIDLVPDTAIWRPRTRWAYEIIRALVEAGEDPNPVTVLRRAQTRPPSDDSPDSALAAEPDVNPAAPYRPRRHHDLALHLFDAYSQTITPAAAGAYAREVLDEAYRRAFTTLGRRMQQFGETGADRADLTNQFTAIRDELADLWRRAEAAAKPGWWQP